MRSARRPVPVGVAGKAAAVAAPGQTGARRQPALSHFNLENVSVLAGAPGSGAARGTASTHRLQRSPLPTHGTQDLHDDLTREYAAETGVQQRDGLQYTSGYAQWLSNSVGNVSFLPPTIRQHSPITRFKARLATGTTSLILNGVEIPDTTPLNISLQQIETLLTPPVVFAAGGAGNAVSCQFDRAYTLKTSAAVDELNAPPVGGWKDHMS